MGEKRAKKMTDKQIKLLLIEDEPGDARLIRVLLDLGLPDSSGLDTFIKVHAQVPDVPIIVLTCLEDATLAIKAVQERGCTGLSVEEQTGWRVTGTLHTLCH